MKAIILVGGYATRLKSITNNGEIAKTLLPITAEGKTQPILYFILDKISLAAKYFDEIIVMTNNKYINQIKEACKNYSSQIKITVKSDNSNSPSDMLGANGTLSMVNSKYISEDYNDDILVLAGDNYFDFSLADLIKFHKQKVQASKSKKGVNTIVSKVYPESEKANIADKFGILDVTNSKRVKSLDEKPGIDKIKSTNVCLAVYIFNRIDFNLIAEYLSQPDLSQKMRDSLGYFINYIISETQTYTFEFDGKFIDIGTPEDYYSISNNKNV